MTTFFILSAISIYIIFYFTYGKFLEKKIVKATKENKVPSQKLYDGVDYVPANKYVLFGHHFASIAGAGPIVGPVLAMAYGWLPGFLWIWFGNIFIGAVHDYMALSASIRYDGKSIQFIASDLISKLTGKSFAWFILFLIILVVAAFGAVIGKIFVTVPGSASAYAFKIFFALILGQLLYKSRLPFWLSTLIGIIFLSLAILGGEFFPLKLSYEIWMIIFFFYIIIASALPVNILLQPRDYMNSFLLYFGLIIGVIAAIFSFKSFEIPAITLFSPPIIGGKPTPFWPAIALIIACGALSGFHSLVASGTSSKQISSEKDALFIGYGAMFTEGLLSTLVIVSIAGYGIIALKSIKGIDTQIAINQINWGQDYIKQIVPALGKGAAPFVKSFSIMVNDVLKIPLTIVNIIAAMWVASFAMTTLDTTNRLGRYIINELAEPLEKKFSSMHKVLTNRWIASIIPAFIGIYLAWSGKYTIMWPAFSGANQLLASITLITISAWIYKKLEKKYTLVALIPGILLWITVTAGLLWYMWKIIPDFITKNAGQGYVVGLINVIMLLLNFVLIVNFIKNFKK